MRATRTVWLWRSTVLVAMLALVALPALGSSSSALSSRFLIRASQTVTVKQYLAHPEQAPANMQAGLHSLLGYAADAKAAHARGGRLPSAPPFGDRMSADVFGLPQNEESVAACGGGTVEGTNDYRGLLNDEVNFSGWHLSTDGGHSLAKEGLLTSIDGLASSGDPVVRADSACNFYSGALNFNFVDPSSPGTNGVGVYRSNAATLTSSSCDTSGEPFTSDPDCWPVRTLVATNAAGHFLDKEWLAVGDTGDGQHVWVTWSDFNCGTGDCSAEAGFTASVMAARCDADLSACTAPINVSGAERDIQFSYPTIGPDGRTYITWAHVTGELSFTPQRFTVEMRVAEAGSTALGPTRTVARIRSPLQFGARLHANTFRIASVPKNTVKLVDGHPRVFVTYDECLARPNGGDVCEEPSVHLAYSDDFGVSWTNEVISAGGDNYFPSIANDPSDGAVVVAYYTNRFDPQFHNRQDVELATIDAATGAVVRLQRVTPDQSNETEADWIVFSSGGGFIGDYIDVAAAGGTAYVAYNSNIHDVKIFGTQGVPVPQQDNYLTVLPE